MKYLLDTNIVSYAIRNRDTDLMQRFAEVGSKAIATSVAVKIELEYGAQLKSSPKLWTSIRNFLAGILILPLTAEDSMAIAQVAAALHQQGQPIGLFDTLIAGHALSQGLTVVTHNTKHFRRVNGLAVEDWYVL